MVAHKMVRANCSPECTQPSFITAVTLTTPTPTEISALNINTSIVGLTRREDHFYVRLCSKTREMVLLAPPKGFSQPSPSSALPFHPLGEPTHLPLSHPSPHLLRTLPEVKPKVSQWVLQAMVVKGLTLGQRSCVLTDTMRSKVMCIFILVNQQLKWLYSLAVGSILIILNL